VSLDLDWTRPALRWSDHQVGATGQRQHSGNPRM